MIVPLKIHDEWAVFGGCSLPCVADDALYYIDRWAVGREGGGRICRI